MLQFLDKVRNRFDEGTARADVNDTEEYSVVVVELDDQPSFKPFQRSPCRNNNI